MGCAPTPAETGDNLRVGQTVRAGDRIATLGRSSNTRQGISKERAHVHFELGFLVNDRFSTWYQETLPGQRNDHGAWNGQNLLGLDPRLILLSQAKLESQFSLLKFVRQQTELCRVLVRDTRFPWLKRYPALIRRNPVADREGVAGFELALDYNGVPFQLVPKAPSEIPSSAKFQLVSVNEPEALKHPCRHLVNRKGGHWELGPRGVQLLGRLTY